MLTTSGFNTGRDVTIVGMMRHSNRRRLDNTYDIESFLQTE